MGLHAAASGWCVTFGAGAQDGHTALHAAASEGDVEGVEVLLRAKALVDSTSVSTHAHRRHRSHALRSRSLCVAA